MIMPLVISEKHDAFIAEYFKMEKESFMNKESLTFARHKNGDTLAI